MVLIEILVAASILAAAIALFLSVLTDASAGVARSRDRSVALAIAADVLRTAQAQWPDVSTSGAVSGYSWTLACEPRPIMRSPRLLLQRCAVEVRRRGSRAQSVRLVAAWAAPAPPFSRP